MNRMIMTPREFAQVVLQEVGKKMYGLDDVIRFCLVALYTDGHVLLEGNPGLGKTALVKTLGETLKLDYKRIQFTPDLMPSDVTGTYMPEVSGDTANMQLFKFQPGPVFTSLLLADEINRATPKTQSAMLEAMAEPQVTVLGKPHSLPRPFFVLATQNPIDHEGTYDLPEAQLDRFMFKIDMPTPSGNDLVRIMNKETGSNKIEIESVSEEDPVATYQRLSQSIKKVEPRPAIHQHICNITQATNDRFFELMDDKDKKRPLNREQIKDIQSIVGLFRYGLGPRAATALMLGAKAWSLLFSKEMDPQTHMQALARVMIPALSHRVKLNYGWKDKYRNWGKNERNKKSYPWAIPDLHSDSAYKEDNLLRKCMLADFCLATAPTQEYRDLVKDVLNECLKPEIGNR